jgi:hypothetical protein
MYFDVKRTQNFTLTKYLLISTESHKKEMTIAWKTLAELLFKSVVEEIMFHALGRASSNVEKTKGYFCDISILHNHMHSL